MFVEARQGIGRPQYDIPRQLLTSDGVTAHGFSSHFGTRQHVRVRLTSKIIVIVKGSGDRG